MITITSREFNQNKSRLLKEVQNGPVVVTHRGKPSMVVLTYDEFCSLSHSVTLAESFGNTDAAVADIEFEIPRFNALTGLRKVEF